MGCIVQQLQNPVPVTVPPSTGICCNNIITPVSNVTIVMKNVNAFILRGKVVCGSGTPTNVADAIVVASITLSGKTSYYVGLTNTSGEYSICVPAPGTYDVQAYKCCCSSVSTSNANCDCTLPSSGASE